MQTASFWLKCEKSKWIGTVRNMNNFSWYVASTTSIDKQVPCLQ
jgi:hypothetical protein